jgi:MFS family permease
VTDRLSATYWNRLQKFYGRDCIAMTDDHQNRRVPLSGTFPWIVCGLAALFFCYGFFHRVAPSVMVSDLMRDFGVNAAVLGNLAAFYFYAYAGMQLPGGVMLDYWGPRRVLTGAAVLCGLGSALFATADGIGEAYAGRFLIGAGAGFTWIGVLKLISIWFPPHRFALVGGLGTMMGMAGAVGGQAPLAAVIAMSGWRATLFGAAFFAAVLAGLIWFVVRDGTQRHPVAGPRSMTEIGRGLVDVMRTPQTWLVALFGSMTVPCVAAFAGLWAVPYMMQAYNLERPAAAATASLVLIGFGIAAPLMGWWSDRIRRRRIPMLSGASVALVAFLTLVYAPGISLTAAYGLLIAYGAGASSFVLSFAAGREHNLPEVAGTAMGFVNMTLMIAGASFQPLIGCLLDLNWDGTMVDGARFYSLEAFRIAFLAFGVSGGMAVVAALLVGETHGRTIRRTSS